MMEILHSSRNYTASLHKFAGLIIESTRRAGGVRMAPEHPQFADYVDAIKTAIDSQEADALCRAIVH